MQLDSTMILCNFTFTMEITILFFTKVDFGVGFLNDKSCREIIIFLSNPTIGENVVKPLNEKNGTILVYYVMVLRQQQQTMKKNSILSKHAKPGRCGLMFFRYNN